MVDDEQLDPRKVAIGRRLIEARKRLDMTPADLARAVGKQPRDIWRWENGRFTPGQSNLKKLAAALSVSTDWLLNGGDLERQVSVVPALEPEVDSADKVALGALAVDGSMGAVTQGEMARLKRLAASHVRRGSLSMGDFEALLRALRSTVVAEDEASGTRRRRPGPVAAND